MCLYVCVCMCLSNNPIIKKKDRFFGQVMPERCNAVKIKLTGNVVHIFSILRAPIQRKYLTDSGSVLVFPEFFITYSTETVSPLYFISISRLHNSSCDFSAA